jgi:hypothetical protein
MKYKFVKVTLDFENNNKKKMLTSQNGDLPYKFIICNCNVSATEVRSGLLWNI